MSLNAAYDYILFRQKEYECMKKIILGIVVGSCGTLIIQHVYKTNEKLQAVIDKAAKEFGLDKPGESGRTLNFFDKCSLIYQRIKRR
jgi:aminopeptidase-like protein